MSNENAAIQFDVNATGAVASINDVKTALAGVGAEATKAGTALEGVNADGAEKVSAKVRSMRDQIQRTTDGVVALARGFDEVAVAEQKISRKGIPLADVSGQLAALREARTELTAVQQKEAVLAAEALKVAQAFKAQEAEAAAAATQIRVYENAVRSAKLEMLSLGKSASEKAQIRGDLFGIDPTVVAKQVSSLKEIEASQLAAATAAQALAAKGGAAMNTLHGSTKAYSAALRQVPAQFTDIIVSLQGGQAPLTVLLQQGGQLKDVFGGAGAAAKALGSYVLGLINPFTIAAAALGTLALAYIKGAAESEAFNKALIMTGNYAGTTALRMSQMAKAISGATGGTIGAAAEALTALAASGDVSAAQFTRLGTAVTQWAKATGMSVGDVAKQFSKLQDEPLKATLALNDSQHYLTRTIYDQIKALEDQGRMLEAGALAQNAWADAIGQRTPLLVENLGVVEKAWRGIVGAAKDAWDAMLNVGRSTDPVSAIKTRISELENLLKNPRTGKIEAGDNQGFMGRRYLEELSLMNQKLALQEKGAGYEAQSAAYQREEAKATEAKVAWAKESDKYLSKQVQMQREIAKAQSLYSQQKPEDQNPAKYAETIAGIQKKYTEAPKHIKAASDAYDTLAATIERSAAASDDYLNTQQKSAASVKFEREQLDAIDKALRQKNISLGQAVELENRLHEATLRAIDVEQRQGASKASQEAIKFMQAENKAYEDHAKVLRASEKAIEDYADSAKLMADDLVFETKLIGLNTAERERAIEQRKIQLELDKEIRIINDTEGLTFEEKESQKAIAMQAAVSKASTAAARSSLNEWVKTADSIRDSLVDAFDSAILAGKDLFTSLRDAAVKLFDGLVLRPILQGVMAPIAGALTSSLFGSVANAATGQIASQGVFGSGGISALSSSIGSAVTTSLPGFWTGLTGSGATAAGASQMGIAASTAPGAFSLGQTMAAIPGWGWAALGVAAVAAIASGRGETRMGAQYYNNGNGTGANLQGGPSGGQIGGDAASKLLEATQVAITDTLKKVGSKATLAGFIGGLESSENGKGFTYSGGTLSTGKSFGIPTWSEAAYMNNRGSKTAEQAMQEFTIEMRQSVLQALQSSTDIPKSIADQLKGVNIDTLSLESLTTLEASIQKVIADVDAFNVSVTSLPFEQLKTLGFDAAAGLIAAAGGLETLGANLATYYQNFYTAEEQRLQTISNINKATAGSGLDAANATRESFRKIVEAQDLSTESGRAMYAALISVSGAFAGLTPVLDSVAATVATTVDALQVAMARAQNANAMADSAMAALAASIDAEKSALSQKYESDLSKLTAAQDAYTQSVTDSISSISASVGALQSLSNRLKSSLANPLAGTDGQQRQSAQALIASVLAIAKSGGGLPKDTSALESALSTVAKPSEKLFGSFEDYARDFYRTSNDIAALSGITDTTLTAQQAMLAQLEAQSAISKAAYSSQAKLLKDQYDQAVKGLNDTLSAAQTQLDALHGIDTSVLSVSAAIDRLAAALGGAKTTQATSNTVTDDTIRGYIANLKTSGGTEADMVITLAKRAKEVGVTQADIARAMSMTEADVASYFASFGIPKFAQGTNYVPSDMVAMVHEGEAIIPKAYNPSAANTGNSDTAAALRALADRLGRIEANTRATAGHTAGTDRKLARVIPGNALITEAAV